MSAVMEAHEPSAKYLSTLQPPLVQHFELMATVPGGVAKLRELILTLAVQGKLVPQDPRDEPASELLEMIRAERSMQAAETRLKQEKGSGWIEEVKLPCTLPNKWTWVRLSQLGEFRGGKTPSTQNSAFWGGHIPWITPKDMKHLSLSDSEDHVTQRAIDDGLALIPSQSILVVVRSGILRRTVPTAVNLVDTAINQDLKALVLVRPELAPYVQLMVRGFERFILENLTKVGTTVESIQFDAFSAQPFPLPPLAEQSRIVARVEELMRLCDALEAKGQLEAAQHAQLVQTLLGALTASTSPDELADNWQRVATHFDLLLDRPEAIDALEHTILQLAVRGLLVPQDPKDEPASELLKKVHAEKDRLIAEGKIKRDKSLQPISDEERAFALPDGWQWARVADVVEMLNGYAFKSEWFKPSGVRLLRNLNVSHGFIDWSSPAAIDSHMAESYQGFALSAGDVVLSLDRPIISTGLKYAVVREADLPCLLLQRVARLAPSKAMSAEYLALWLQSDAFVGTIDPGRSNGVPHISTKQVGALPIALPPLLEQSRIVALVDSLRRLCADLRHRLAVRQTTQAQLAEALIDEVA